MAGGVVFGTVKIHGADVVPALSKSLELCFGGRVAHPGHGFKLDQIQRRRPLDVSVEPLGHSKCAVMNLRILGKHLTEKKLWRRRLKDFSEQDIECLVDFISKQAIERHLAMGDFGYLKTKDEVKGYFKRLSPELRSSIFQDELIRAYEAKLEELREPKELKKQETCQQLLFQK